MIEGFDFLEILILVLLGLLFFKEQMAGAITAWFKPESKRKEEVPTWAAQLMQHFNHDTTDQHNLTHAKLDRIETKIDRHNELELGNSGKLDEIIRTVSR